MLEKWKQYFGKLLNCETPIKTFTWTPIKPNDIDFPPLSRKEIIKQFNKLKNYKATRENGVLKTNFNELGR